MEVIDPVTGTTDCVRSSNIDFSYALFNLSQRLIQIDQNGVEQIANFIFTDNNLLQIITDDTVINLERQ